jgi:uncharacterized protein
MIKATITKTKLANYFKITETALSMVKITQVLSNKDRELCEKYLDFCRRYLSDAWHFESKGDRVNAFAALNYAHAWLDAAAVSGWFDIKHKNRNKYFTID